MMRKSLCQHGQHIQGSWFSLSTQLYLRFLSSILHPALGRMRSCWSVQQKPQSCSRERWSHPWSSMVSKFPSNTNYCMTAWFCGWQHCCRWEKNKTQKHNTKTWMAAIIVKDEFLLMFPQDGFVSILLEFDISHVTRVTQDRETTQLKWKSGKWFVRSFHKRPSAKITLYFWLHVVLSWDFLYKTEISLRKIIFSNNFRVGSFPCTYAWEVGFIFRTWDWHGLRSEEGMGGCFL